MLPRPVWSSSSDPFLLLACLTVADFRFPWLFASEKFSPAVAWRWWLLVGAGLTLLHHCAYTTESTTRYAALQPACSLGL
eukprot:SAG31_NODE_33317_length_345_cov_0.837398_1_plen_79_part_10